MSLLVDKIQTMDIIIIWLDCIHCLIDIKYSRCCVHCWRLAFIQWTQHSFSISFSQLRRHSHSQQWSVSRWLCNHITDNVQLARYCNNIILIYLKVDRDISVGIATRYGLRGSNLGGGQIFRTRPNQLWGPPNLLHNGYRVFPGGKAAGVWRWPPTPT